jgi:hypothetical protein
MRSIVTVIGYAPPLPRSTFAAAGVLTIWSPLTFERYFFKLERLVVQLASSANVTGLAGRSTGLLDTFFEPTRVLLPDHP